MFEELLEYGVAVTLKPDRRRLRPGQTIDVDVVLADDLDDLRGYQLHVAVSGGTCGSLELVDIAIPPDTALVTTTRESRESPRGQVWFASNLQTLQMVAGLDTVGVAVAAGGLLARLTLQASADARGRFIVDLRHDVRNAADRTILFPTPADQRIAVTLTTAAVIAID